MTSVYTLNIMAIAMSYDTWFENSCPVLWYWVKYTIKAKLTLIKALYNDIKDIKWKTGKNTICPHDSSNSFRRNNYIWITMHINLQYIYSVKKTAVEYQALRYFYMMYYGFYRCYKNPWLSIGDICQHKKRVGLQKWRLSITATTAPSHFRWVLMTTGQKDTGFTLNNQIPQSSMQKCP